MFEEIPEENKLSIQDEPSILKTIPTDQSHLLTLDICCNQLDSIENLCRIDLSNLLKLNIGGNNYVRISSLSKTYLPQIMHLQLYTYFPYVDAQKLAWLNTNEPLENWMFEGGGAHQISHSIKWIMKLKNYTPTEEDDWRQVLYLKGKKRIDNRPIGNKSVIMRKFPETIIHGFWRY